MEKGREKMIKAYIAAVVRKKGLKNGSAATITLVNNLAGETGVNSNEVVKILGEFGIKASSWR